MSEFTRGLYLSGVHSHSVCPEHTTAAIFPYSGRLLGPKSWAALLVRKKCQRSIKSLIMLQSFSFFGFVSFSLIFNFPKNNLEDNS